MTAPGATTYAVLYEGPASWYDDTIVTALAPSDATDFAYVTDSLSEARAFAARYAAAHGTTTHILRQPWHVTATETIIATIAAPVGA